MRIGVICSGNGGTFKASHKLLMSLSYNIDFFLITDRKCDIESYSLNAGIVHERIENSCNAEFSIMAKRQFDDFGGVDFIILFYTRLVTHELLDFYPVFNIHPSLLPAFKGLSAISETYENKSKYLGATLHCVDGFMDEGVIMCQSSIPISPEWNEDILNKYSFMQRVYLFILLIILFHSKKLVYVKGKMLLKKSELTMNCRFNPEIVDKKVLSKLIELSIINGTRIIPRSD